MNHSGTDAREFINNQRTMYADIARRIVEDDVEKRPVIVADDPLTGKVLVVTLKPVPDMAKGWASSGQQIIGPPRIESLNSEQYLVFMGDRNDLLHPLVGTKWAGSQPREIIKEYVAKETEKRKKIPEGEELARIIHECLNDPIHTGSYITDSFRPRHLTTALISNYSSERNSESCKGR